MIELVNKLEIEQKELQDKINKLNLFISDNPAFKKLDKEMQEMLQDQFQYMRYYNAVLLRRIIYIVRKETNV